jgi:stage V sporulation protein S
MNEQYQDTIPPLIDTSNDDDVEARHSGSNTPDVIKVSAKSRATAVAGAIAGVIREHRYAEVQAIGAGAVNQAVKAMAIARVYLERDELDIAFLPYFTEVDIEGQERTAVRFHVESRPAPRPASESEEDE